MNRTASSLTAQLTATAAAAASALALATPALAYEMPLLAHDLNPGERVYTFSHGTSDVAQTHGKDLLVYRRVTDSQWTRLKEGASDLGVNGNYLIYDQPVYAMASGKVVACWRNAPENAGNVKHAQVATRKITLGGNHLWILQDDGRLALYAHARTGSIPATLCPNNNTYLNGTAWNFPHWTQPETTVSGGATVSAGQMLFRAGNSGNSSEPHLHVHVVDSQNNAQPMTFARGQTTSFANFTASLDGPWTRLQGNALPPSHILVWPPHPVGYWTHNGIEAAAYQRMFTHYADSGVMLDTVSCANNGASYNTTWVPAQGYWLAHHGMSLADFVSKNTTYTGQGYQLKSYDVCGSVAVAVWRKP